MKALFISPHDDDATLFGAFSVMADDCDVLVVYDSYVQVARGAEWCDKETRERETVESLAELGISKEKIFRARLRDDAVYPDFEPAIQGIHGYDRFYVPKHADEGHAQHNDVNHWVMAAIKKLTPPRSVLFYGTYTPAGKMVLARGVVPTPEMIQRKLRALACYGSQIRLENCRDHFMRDLREYVKVHAE